MKKRKNLERITTFRLSDRLRQSIRNTAYQLSQTESQFIRRAIEEAIRQRSPYGWLAQ